MHFKNYLGPRKYIHRFVRIHFILQVRVKPLHFLVNFLTLIITCIYFLKIPFKNTSPPHIVILAPYKHRKIFQIITLNWAINKNEILSHSGHGYPKGVVLEVLEDASHLIRTASSVLLLHPFCFAPELNQTLTTALSLHILFIFKRHLLMFGKA